MKGNIGHIAEISKDNIRAICANFKKEGFGWKEYLALAKLSLKGNYWLKDKNREESYDSPNWINWLRPAFFAYTVIILIQSIPGSFATMFIGRSFFGALATLVFNTIVNILFVLFAGWLTFDMKRLKQNLHYTETAWYKNTGLKPSQTAEDVGVYGEYIGTLAAETFIVRNGVYGKVFNNVVIPKRDGNFNEIDVLSVSEIGIEVIEAKARRGHFEGTLLDDKWKQNGSNEMKNPMKQNLGHCNTLAEYLYDKLPKGALGGRDIFLLMRNVVLFTLVGIKDDININKHPYITYYLGMSEAYETSTRNDRLLTRAEVDQICSVLEQLPRYTPEQMKNLVEARNAAYNCGKFKRERKYYVVKLEHLDAEGQPWDAYLVCKDDGLYQVYNNVQDGWYQACPGAVIKGKTNSTRSEAEIYRYFQTLSK